MTDEAHHEPPSVLDGRQKDEIYELLVAGLAERRAARLASAALDAADDGEDPPHEIGQRLLVRED